MLEMHNRINCFISYIVCGLLLYIFSFETLIDKNPMVLDPKIEGATSFEK